MAEKVSAAQQKRERTPQERYPDQFFTSPAGHPRDRIIIHENKDLPKEGLFFGLNGFQFLAKAGVEIDIPRPVRLMLDTRVQTETFKDDNGVIYTRDIPRITYTLIKEDVDQPEPTEEESSNMEDTF